AQQERRAVRRRTRARFGNRTAGTSTEDAGELVPRRAARMRRRRRERFGGRRARWRLLLRHRRRRQRSVLRRPERRGLAVWEGCSARQRYNPEPRRED